MLSQQIQVVGSVALGQLLGLPQLGQPRRCELPHQLVDAIAPDSQVAQQRGIDQRRQACHPRGGDRLGRHAVEGALEHRQPGQRLPLRLA